MFAAGGPVPSDPRDDPDLIDDINQGDAPAFDVLYARHRDWVHRLAWRFTGNREDALDVLQETFIYLLGKFPGFRLSVRLSTFLYPVVKNISLSILRKRGRLARDDAMLNQVTARPSAGESTSDLMVVVAAVPAAQREVLLMRFVDDMSLQEIAEALQVPLGTVKSRLHYALAVLRDDECTRRYFGVTDEG